MDSYTTQELADTYSKHRTQLIAAAKAALGWRRRDMAEDAVQEAVMDAFRWGGYDAAKGSMIAWLMRCVYRRASRMRKREVRRGGIPFSQLFRHHAKAVLNSPVEGPERSITAWDRIEEALARSPKHVRVWAQAYGAGDTFEEIGRAAGLTRQAIQAALALDKPKGAGYTDPTSVARKEA